MKIFYKWGEILLQDFNSIYAHRINGEDLYQNLKSIEKIERWSFSSEQLTQNQENFNDFWMKQGEIFRAFSSYLEENNKASSSYALKKVLDQKDKLFDKYKGVNFILAGFNALQKGEQELIDLLMKIGDSRFYVDHDAFFTEGRREAGYFYRQLKKKYSWPGLSDLDENFSKEKKEISFIQVDQRNAISLVNAEILSRVEDLEDTCVVLADESQLESVLSYLPKKVDKINITMGYKLRYTAAYDLFTALYSLQIRRRKKLNELYHKDLVRMINHPYVNIILASSLCAKINDHLLKNNLVFVRKEHIKEIKMPVDKLQLINELLFPEWKVFPMDPSAHLLNSIDRIQSMSGKALDMMNREYLYHLRKTVVQDENIMDDMPFEPSLRSYKLIFNEAIRSQSLSFQGEPLEGLQLMGLLETRALDFRHHILLGANEGKLPKTSYQQSFIPYESSDVLWFAGKKRAGCPLFLLLFSFDAKSRKSRSGI